MSKVLSFAVHADPEPQGSARAFVVGGGRAVVTSDNPHLKRYRRAIALAATLALPASWAPLAGPVVVYVKFTIKRPASVSAKKRPTPMVRPDLDKLLRAALDGLTGIAYVDDAQVVALTTLKVYGDEGVTEITVTEGER